MPVWCRFLILVIFAAFPAPSSSSELLLEWTKELPAGSPQWTVRHYLEDRGIRPVISKGGLTYTSMISSPQRDYLFCNKLLFSIIKGEHVDGARFNYWMTAFLATQQKYGDPVTVEYQNLLRQIKFRWNLKGDAILYFLIRAAIPDFIIWSQQLVHKPTSRSCR